MYIQSLIIVKYNLSQGDQDPNLKCEDDCPALSCLLYMDAYKINTYIKTSTAQLVAWVKSQLYSSMLIVQK